MLEGGRDGGGVGRDKDDKPAIAVWGSTTVIGLTSKVRYYRIFLRRAQDNFKFC